jgi:serine/threonine protein kinase/tetratricopeptide (TPR) repeat protein
VPVCNAIQHAHLKGIIHRDVKPSNVLIMLHDDRPVPKVIDFGVAKALHQHLTEKTVYTRFAQMIGTPLYMSPEQAQMSGLDIDTRSDIYSLGVLLYELLTGTTPFNKERLAKAAYDELLKIIREEEPPKPSVRLSQSTDSLPSIAAQRKTEPGKLSKMFDGDLDWIAMKALEKDRSRRYETANAFSADVLRYLNDEPVEASPPSAAYRLRKFARKHRKPVIALAVIVAVLLLGIAGTTWGLFRAKQAEAEAEANSRVAKELAHSRAVALGRLGEREQQLRLELFKSAITASSKQIDLDLAEAKTDSRSALLRLARSSQNLSNIQIPRLDGQVEQEQLSRLRDLRTFVAAAVIGLGQDYASLMSPLMNDPKESFNKSSRRDVSNDGRNLLTQNAGTVRLWDLRTATRTALLRQGAEKIITCGFSPDGKTIYTNDTDSVVRFWATSDGRFLSKSGLRESRFVYPGKLSFSQIVQIADSSNLVRMTNSTALVQGCKVTNVTFDKSNAGGWQGGENGTAELIEVASGRIVARLDRPGHKIEKFQVSPDGRWIIAVEDNSQVVIFAAADGREATRLVHPPNSYNFDVWVSPNTRRIMTRLPPNQQPNGESLRGFIRLWEANPWRRVPDPVLDQLAGDNTSRFLTDDLVEVGPRTDEGIAPESLYRIGGSNSPTPPGCWVITAELGGELLRYNRTELLDGQSLKRLAPPAGRKFHPALKRLTSDGRFFFSFEDISGPQRTDVTDTATEKQIPLPWFDGQQCKYFPRFGTIGTFKIDHGWHVLIFPAPEYLEVRPVLLELWAQVAARGHLDDAGAFVKWDELTWEQKRQELASKPVPYANFPFPGHLSGDRLYWLRQEFENANNADKLRFARQLLDRANAAGDKVEAARLIAVVASNVVDGLLEKLLLRADVQERLRQDVSLDREVRAAALIEAANLVEDANDLNNQSWQVAARPDAEKGDYRRALRWAEAAVKHEPENPNFVTTLGVLQYRNGLYRDAIATLVRSREANRRNENGPQPSDLAFLAMAHQALGHAAEAQEYFRHLTDLLKQDKWKSDNEAKAFFEETKRTLARKP